MNTISNHPTSPGKYIWSVQCTENKEHIPNEINVKEVGGVLIATDEHGADFGPVEKLKKGSWSKN